MDTATRVRLDRFKRKILPMTKWKRWAAYKAEHKKALKKEDAVYRRALEAYWILGGYDNDEKMHEDTPVHRQTT